MNLLIAEKPSVAVSSYKKLLETAENEQFQKKDGFLQGRNWIISWFVGHLVGLAMPEEYGWKEWNMETLPMIPEQWKLNVLPATKKQYRIVSGLMKKADLIVNGTDAGREGELIYRLVAQLAGCSKKPQKRFWVNSFVLKDMLKSWNQLKDISAYNNLAQAAFMRTKGDWLIGLNASRGYVLKTGVKNLSVGRVQTPTLNLIVQRDYEVENWTDKFYFQLSAVWKNIPFIYYQEENSKFDAADSLDEIIRQIHSTPATLVKKETSPKKQNAPGLFDLAGLQKSANRTLSLNASETLKTAQSLYEKKIISYPRTDSAFLPENMKNEVFQLLFKLTGEEQKQHLIAETDKCKWFNNDKVTDHYAIIPTGININNAELTEKEQKLYQLIEKQFITAFGKPYEYNQTHLILDCAGFIFKTNVNIETYKGFKALFENKESNSNDDILKIDIKQIQEGDSEIFTKLNVDKKKVTPPKYFTEATLISAMETAGREIDSEELRESMKERGLGTPATKSEIIETLKRREYIYQKGKNLISTRKGRALIQIVDKRLKSPEMTGEWEYRLRQIEKGKYKGQKFYNELLDYISTVIDEIKRSNSEYFSQISVAENDQQPDCPACNGKIKINKGGAFCINDCGVKIFRNIAGKRLSDNQLLKLITVGKTGTIKGFESKAGKKFDAKLIFSPKEKKIIFSFE